MFAVHLKKDGFINGKQYSSKNYLCEAIKTNKFKVTT